MFFQAAEIGLEAFGHNIENQFLVAALDRRIGELAQLQRGRLGDVGAANRPARPCLNFAKVASRVVLLVRGSRLEDSMSEYLVARVTAADNVEVRYRTEVVAAHGDDHLESVTLADRDTGAERGGETNWLFVFIGALPAPTGSATPSSATRRASS